MSNSPNQKSIYTKIFLFLAIVSFLVTSSFSSFPLFTNQEVQCYHDIGHETFSTINDAVIKSENYKNALLIISGIFTDFLFIVFVYSLLFIFIAFVFISTIRSILYYTFEYESYSFVDLKGSLFWTISICHQLLYAIIYLWRHNWLLAFCKEVIIQEVKY